MFKFRNFNKLALATKVARTAEAFFKQNFRRQGFLDASLKAWAKRNPDRSPGRAVLVKTGFLRRSIQAIKITAKHIRIQSNAKYGSYHNEGIGQKKRQFVGNSATLNAEIKKIIKGKMKQVFKR